MKKITSIVMALVVAISGMTIMPWKVEAASNLKINGVDIGYAPKQYFSETGKQCTCHNKEICVPKRSGCVCKHVNGTAQCYAFALWCENKMFGYNDFSKPTKFKSVGSIAVNKVNKSNIKELISKTPIGAHIRTWEYGGRSGHSMILMSKDDKKFTVAQANGGNNNEYSGHYNCRIGTATYTWSGYAKSSYAARGIKFVKIPKDMKVKPDAPTLTSCKAISDTVVEIGWKKVSGAKKYKIIRHEVDWANKKTFYTTGEKYTDKGLKPGTTYFYTVYAVSDSETSSRSLIYKIYTKPSAPKGLAVKANSESQLTISWNKVSGAGKYKVLFHESGKSWKVLKNDLTTNSYTHKGLEAGKKYYYQVVAMRVGEIGLEGKRAIKAVESAQSETKVGFTKMARPSNQVNENLTDVVLNWKAAKGDANKTYVYNIYRDGSSQPINGSGKYITGISYTDKSASSGKIHKYRVEIVEQSGSAYTKQGGSDNFYAGSRIAKEISVTPESETAMRIIWDTPSSAPNGIKYVLQKYDDVKGAYVKCAETANTYYTDKDVTAGKTYKYYIQMLDGNGNYLTETSEKSAVLELSAERITLNKSSAVLETGESITLEATIEPDGSSDKTVTWTSSNDTVATVDRNTGVVTAKAEGNVRITATTKNGKTAVCTITVLSSECSHQYGEWVIDQPAGCEQGSRHRECSKCKAVETEPIPATGHSYSEELQVTKKATCKEEGEQARVCTKCGAKIDISVVGKTGHTFGDTWEVSKEPTCSETGSRYRVCTVCGVRETEIIDAVDHKYELTSQTEPTLDFPGTRTYTCQNCKDAYTEEWVNIVEEGEISIGGAAANVGNTVEIPVTITDNPGIAGFTFQVNYDKSVLTPTEISAGELLKKDGSVIGTFTSNLEQGIPAANLEQVTVHWNNSSGVTGDGNLFYIKFTVGSNAEKGRYPIWITYEDGNITNQNMEDIKPDILDNVITIADVIRGDVTQDSVVNINDGILLAKYLAKWNITFNDRQLKAADVYIDNKVNVKDGVRLAQLLAGYGDTEDTDTAEARTYLAAAGSKPQISVENFEGVAGDTIYLPVMIDKNTGIAGFDLELKYDSSYLTPVSVEKGGLLEEGDFSSNLDEGSESAAETIAVHWSNVDNMAEDGELFAVEFEIKADTELGKTLPVEISNVQDAICDKNLDTVEVSLAQGGVKTVTHSEDIVDPHDFDVYKIEGVSMKSSSGAACEEIPANGDFDVAVSFSSTADEVYPAEFVAAAYDANGALLATASKAITQEMLSEETLTGNCSLHIGKTTAKIAEIKVFLWDSSHGMAPLAEPITISKKAL